MVNEDTSSRKWDRINKCLAPIHIGHGTFVQLQINRYFRLLLVLLLWHAIQIESETESKT